MLNQKIWILLSFFLMSHLGFSQKVTISVASDVAQQLRVNDLSFQIQMNVGEISLIEIEESLLPLISHLAHEDFKRCGGYVVEESSFLGSLALDTMKERETSFKAPYFSDQDSIKKILPLVDSNKMKATIEKLSSFQNRYYQSQHGVDSQTWIYNSWKELAEGRDDVEVSFFEHRSFAQPSVVLKIKGTESPDEHIILGGHGDSIAGWFPSSSTRAPGADDNASGIATLTESLRVFLATGKRPEKSIEFISYAAEEVGLRGSKEIAESYEAEKKEISAVLQFDMTNFSGSPYDFILINDYTTGGLSSYLGSLIDTYLPDYSWRYDECGYACSDHVSWYRAGYAVAFPFESTFDAHNEKIHTRGDILSASDDSAVHASKFAKLAVAFLLEMTSKEEGDEGSEEI